VAQQEIAVLKTEVLALFLAAAAVLVDQQAITEMVETAAADLLLFDTQEVRWVGNGALGRNR
jgi:hypothetical protein